jgi:hypothetical protein
MLRNQPGPESNGSFTFQASLWRNGSIWFVYKEVPMNVSDIRDVHHPRKVGLSDVYLDNANAATGGKLFTQAHTGTGIPILREYRRVDIDFSNVTTYATIIIDPKLSRRLNTPGAGVQTLK